MAKFTDESVRAALADRLAVREYPFPGATDTKVGIRILTDVEVDDARLEAQSYVAKRKVDLVLDPEFLDRVLMRETISRAFVDIDEPEDAFFGSGDQVAELDNALVLACFELYKRHQVTMDPFAHCSREEVHELIELVKKASDKKALGSLFDAPTLWTFVLSLVSMLLEMQATHKSPPG